MLILLLLLFVVLIAQLPLHKVILGQAALDVGVEVPVRRVELAADLVPITNESGNDFLVGERDSCKGLQVRVWIASRLVPSRNTEAQ